MLTDPEHPRRVSDSASIDAHINGFSLPLARTRCRNSRESTSSYYRLYSDRDNAVYRSPFFRVSRLDRFTQWGQRIGIKTTADSFK